MREGVQFNCSNTRALIPQSNQPPAPPPLSACVLRLWLPRPHNSAAFIRLQPEPTKRPGQSRSPPPSPVKSPPVWEWRRGDRPAVVCVSAGSEQAWTEVSTVQREKAVYRLFPPGRPRAPISGSRGLLGRARRLQSGRKRSVQDTFEGKELLRKKPRALLLHDCQGGCEAARSNMIIPYAGVASWQNKT